MIAHHGNHPGFIDGDPIGNPVAEMFHQNAGIIGEILGGLTGGPAAVVFQHLREVPVEKGREGFDIGFQQFVHQPVVEGSNLLD